VLVIQRRVLPAGGPISRVIGVPGADRARDGHATLAVSMLLSADGRMADLLKLQAGGR
jgi:hypothetical protein